MSVRREILRCRPRAMNDMPAAASGHGRHITTDPVTENAVVWPSSCALGPERRKPEPRASLEFSSVAAGNRPRFGLR